MYDDMNTVGGKKITWGRSREKKLVEAESIESEETEKRLVKSEDEMEVVEEREEDEG